MPRFTSLANLINAALAPTDSAADARYVGSTGMQCPPTPALGLNFIKPNGFVSAASKTSCTEIPRACDICANSLTSAILTCLNVFSNNFAASATSGVDTSTISPQKPE